jgi:anti-sigma factor RsiW
MNCAKFQEMLERECVGALDPADREVLDLHLAECGACREEREYLLSLWKDLERIPLEEPSHQMRARFHAMLDGYRHASEKSIVKSMQEGRFLRALKPWLRPTLQFGMGMILVVLGGLAGYWIGSNANGHEEIASLREEVGATRQMLAVALLGQSSASERLKGVSWSAQVSSPDSEFLETLFHTLNSDPNVNVRLAAMDALARFAVYPKVRHCLIKSLSGQDAPLVQIMLIDKLVQLHERQSIDVFKQVIQDENQNPQVQERAQWGLQQFL